MMKLVTEVVLAISRSNIERVSTHNLRVVTIPSEMLVFVKAAINITDGSLRDLNRIFHMLFGDRGQVCALHVGTMVMRILMRFPIDDYIRALLTTETMTPIPAGVGWDLYEVPVHTFGFEFSGLKPFNQGAFAREPIHVPSA